LLRGLRSSSSSKQGVCLHRRRVVRYHVFMPEDEKPKRNHADYNDLLDISERLIHAGLDRIYLHLRDARELVNLANHSVMAKATIVLASAALESNLAHLTLRAQAFGKAKPGLYSQQQLDYLACTQTIVTDRGALKEVSQRQGLEERLQIVPDLLARAFDLRYELPKSGEMVRKLRRTIELRDGIIHPRWDRYLPEVTALEAAQSIDAVELYLGSILRQLHPYLVGYIGALSTIRGFDKHDVGIGHRTSEKRVAKSKFVPMTSIGIKEVLAGEWMNMKMLCQFALESGTEGDSGGSLLTRVALVLLFAGVDAQLSIVSQWRLHDASVSFHPAERNFLEENLVGLGQDGEVEVLEDRQSFKKRIVAVPTILANRVDGKQVSIDIGTAWGEQILKSHELRNTVVHAPPNEPLPRVTQTELRAAIDAVTSYFRELELKAPETFKAQGTLLKHFVFPKN
jgi:hypothetical protein